MGLLSLFSCLCLLWVYPSIHFLSVIHVCLHKTRIFGYYGFYLYLYGFYLPMYSPSYVFLSIIYVRARLFDISREFSMKKCPFNRSTFALVMKSSKQHTFFFSFQSEKCKKIKELSKEPYLTLLTQTFYHVYNYQVLYTHENNKKSNKMKLFIYK